MLELRIRDAAIKLFRHLLFTSLVTKRSRSMKCPFCKAEIPDNARFCTRCGRNLPRRDRSENEGHSPDGTFMNGGNGTGSNEQQSADSREGFGNENRSEKTDFSGTAGSSGAGAGFSGYGQTSGSAGDNSGNGTEFSGYANGVNRGFQRPKVDPQLADAIKGIDTMNVMQIVCLALTFIPFLNMFGGLLLLVILIMSFSLTSRVERVFDRFAYPQYAAIASGVRTKCIFILSMIPLFVIDILLLSIGFATDNETLAIAGGIGVSILSVMSIVTFIFQVICFCRLYTVKNALEQLSLGNKLPEKPSYGGAAVIIVIAALFVILFIVGILAAILIPAYTEYTKHVKTHDVSLSSEFSGFSTPLNVLKISKQEVNSGLNQFSEIVLIGEEVKKEA